MQGYVLDAAISLVNMLESDTFNLKDAAESAQALKLIGNGSAHLSYNREKPLSA